ncbi:hypothetical protein MTR67_043902 [Solanum verrucosum]|uniref:Uncharacterized protein n=1 Tax=Solanum verrucosum TaxID=315347 RepID=A0AAF0UQH4_SOLVR|nr:hypothetical protein MTR67_043902 [Solanum verrucosum]
MMRVHLGANNGSRVLATFRV